MSYRSRIAKLNSAIELQSQMKPFSFVENELDRSKNRCFRRSVSSPNLPVSVEKCVEQSNKFKAKPCPTNLFSNYFSQKMWEDEYFR